jgi:YaiO family outer membrane protein
LPAFRFDNDLNFKLGQKQNIVWTVGISYVLFHNVNQDLSPSTGFTLYWKDWIGEYRIFNSHSYPGNIVSYTNLVKLGYGREKWQWTYLTVYIGKDAYLATYISPSQKVNEQYFNAVLSHRHSIKKIGALKQI